MDWNKAVATTLILAKEITGGGHGEELSADNYITI